MLEWGLERLWQYRNHSEGASRVASLVTLQKNVGRTEREVEAVVTLGANVLLAKSRDILHINVDRRKTTRTQMIMRRRPRWCSTELKKFKRNGDPCDKWVLDSGSTSHMCNYEESFISFTELKVFIYLRNNDSMDSMRHGTVWWNDVMRGCTRRSVLKDVLYVPNIM